MMILTMMRFVVCYNKGHSSYSMTCSMRTKNESPIIKGNGTIIPVEAVNESKLHYYQMLALYL